MCLYIPQCSICNVASIQVECMRYFSKKYFLVFFLARESVNDFALNLQNLIKMLWLSIHWLNNMLLQHTLRGFDQIPWDEWEPSIFSTLWFDFFLQMSGTFCQWNCSSFFNYDPNAKLFEPKVYLITPYL